MTELGGSWIVIAGAGGALGSALLRHYADGPRHVLGLDRSLAAIEGKVSSQHVKLALVDASSEDDVRDALRTKIPERERISLLLNATGQIWNEPILSLSGGRFATHSIDRWRDVIAANLTAPFVVAATVAARMARAGGGAIINFSSIASGGNPGQAAYSAAKAGLEGLTRTMAAELGPIGIRTNAIALGFVDVESTRKALTEQQLEGYVHKTPVGRLGTLDDVISAVEFLDGNSFVNGEVLKVDGGIRL